jgi:hypothetical protein
VLHLVRNNRPFTAILLSVFVLVLHFQGVTHATLPIASDNQLVYSAIIKALSFVFGDNSYAFSILTVLLLYIQAIWLNIIASQHRLFIHSTYLISFSFITLSSLHPSFSSFSPLLLVNFLIILSISEILKLKNASKPNKHLFNIGFYIMIAALIHFSAIFIIFFLFFALLILRPFNIREWVVSILGLLMPIYFLSVYLFCTDSLMRFSLWPRLDISISSQMPTSVYTFGLALGLFLWISSSLFTMQAQLTKAPIYIRRCWISFSFLLGVSFFASFFTMSQIRGVWVICLPALSLILTQAFQNERNAKLNTISFYFALALVLFCQIFLPLQ